MNVYAALHLAVLPIRGQACHRLVPQPLASGRTGRNAQPEAAYIAACREVAHCPLAFTGGGGGGKRE